MYVELGARLDLQVLVKSGGCGLSLNDARRAYHNLGCLD